MAETKYKLIAEELVRRMRKGEFAGRLPSQRALMAEFGVSSRTLHKVFQLLKRRQCITPSPRGTQVTAAPPERPGRIAVFVPVAEPVTPEDPLYRRLAERIAADGCEAVPRHAGPLADADWDAMEFRPGDGCIFPYSTFRIEYAAALRERSVPFVVGNRVAPEAGVHWVDWNHLDLFDSIVGELVARGAREIGLFCSRTEPRHFPGNLPAIQQDFIAAKRGYFLFNRELDAMPAECFDDVEAYLGYLSTLHRRPDVILCLNSAQRRRLIEGLTADGDRSAEARVLLLNPTLDEKAENFVVGVYGDEGYRKIADKLWTLFRQILDNPDLKPCGLKQRCTIQYGKSFLKSKFLPTTERSLQHDQHRNRRPEIREILYAH